MRRLIESFCHAYGLGSLLAEPEPVTGGLMHAMYRVRTSQGNYAVKALNADIMQRPTAYQNMVNSEIVSNALQETVPLVAARRFAWPAAQQEQLETELQLKTPLTAPVAAGTPVGEAVFSLNGREIGRIDLLCGASVAPAVESALYHLKPAG